MYRLMCMQYTYVGISLNELQGLRLYCTVGRTEVSTQPLPPSFSFCWPVINRNVTAASP